MDLQTDAYSINQVRSQTDCMSEWGRRTMTETMCKIFVVPSVQSQSNILIDIPRPGPVSSVLPKSCQLSNGNLVFQSQGFTLRYMKRTPCFRLCGCGASKHRGQRGRNEIDAVNKLCNHETYAGNVAVVAV